MNKLCYTTIFILLTNFTFGQTAPLPPKPPEQEKIGTNDTSNLQIMHDEQAKTILPKFEISLNLSLDKKSAYYYKTVENKLIQLDTSITSEQIISLTKFNISKNQINPKLLDSLANVTYKLNEEKNYLEAIKTAQLILEMNPNNITGHKEISFSYNRVGNDRLSNKHFGMMVKIITSVFKYSDGTYAYPFIINNFFEGISIYEAAFRCKPNKITIMLDKHKRVLGAYKGYSSSMDEILIRYSELTHWKSQLKEGDYIEEEKLH